MNIKEKEILFNQLKDIRKALESINAKFPMRWGATKELDEIIKSYSK